jgi:hypothetical protein
MTPPRPRHPYIELFASALFPAIIGAQGGNHSKDPPPVERLLPQGLTAPELRDLLEHFVAADHDARADRYTAAIGNLELAEAHLRRVASLGGSAKPSYESALGDVAVAREAAGRKDSAHTCGAIGSAVRAIAGAPTKG